LGHHYSRSGLAKAKSYQYLTRAADQATANDGSSLEEAELLLKKAATHASSAADWSAMLGVVKKCAACACDRNQVDKPESPMSSGSSYAWSFFAGGQRRQPSTGAASARQEAAAALSALLARLTVLEAEYEERRWACHQRAADDAAASQTGRRGGPPQHGDPSRATTPTERTDRCPPLYLAFFASPCSPLTLSLCPRSTDDYNDSTAFARAVPVAVSDQTLKEQYYAELEEAADWQRPLISLRMNLSAAGGSNGRLALVKSRGNSFGSAGSGGPGGGTYATSCGVDGDGQSSPLSSGGTLPQLSAAESMLHRALQRASRTDAPSLNRSQRSEGSSSVGLDASVRSTRSDGGALDASLRAKAIDCPPRSDASSGLDASLRRGNAADPAPRSLSVTHHSEAGASLDAKSFSGDRSPVSHASGDGSVVSGTGLRGKLALAPLTTVPTLPNDK